MKTIVWSALTISLGAALLAGCGGTQPPIGAPGAIPESHTLARPSYQLLYSFTANPDGANPNASLINVRGTLYGTTDAGGTRGKGTVFSISTRGREHVLYSFGQHYRGEHPLGSLIDTSASLYGTTSGGGMYHRGTVFSLSMTGKQHVLYSFGAGSADGREPQANLIDVHGTLYGTTFLGGAKGCLYSPAGCGTVFSITPSGMEKVLHSFGSGGDGADPFGLIQVKGTFYGTTWAGGSYSCGNGQCGTVFSITPGGKEKVLYSFGNGTDGENPLAGLIDVNGTLYGTTVGGGAYGSGTVFSVTTSGTEKVLHSFGAAFDGAHPIASLIDVDGTLYGTTQSGGSYGVSEYGGFGTIFSITTDGTEKVLHNFGSHASVFDGRFPRAGLIDVHGTLYGTTTGGGTPCPVNSLGCGTVFALTP